MRQKSRDFFFVHTTRAEFQKLPALLSSVPRGGRTSSLSPIPRTTIGRGFARNSKGGEQGWFCARGVRGQKG